MTVAPEEPPSLEQDVATIFQRLDVARRANPGLDADFLRFVAEMLPQAHRAHGQLFQDLWALWETGGSGGYFAEFGACDGVFLSNTVMLERDHGWRGVLAEPNPIFADAIVRHRRCFVDHRCVWRTSGERVAFKMVAEPEYSVIGAVDPQDWHESVGKREDHQAIEVDTVTLLDLLRAADAPRRINYLSLDTEGSELDILQAFDFDAYDVRLITVEHNWTPRRADIQALLFSKGYRLRFPDMTRWDDWFIR